MQHTKNDVIRETTNAYIQQIDKNNIPLPSEIEANLINLVEIQIEAENSIRPKGRKWKAPETLSPMQIATIMIELDHVRRIRMAETMTDEDDYDLVGMYTENGTYSCSESLFFYKIKEYNYNATEKDIRECMKVFQAIAPRVKRTNDQDLIAVNNGIFDYKNKTLLPFSPDYVFLSKSSINYNPNAACITIHNQDDGTDWDIDTWMDELSDDPDTVNLLWQILGAIIRPNVRWDKSAWFYSESGNNGKGTLCELMKQLCGQASYVSLPLADMGIDFKLEPLLHASAIIVDENDVGTFIDKAANLKAIITGDSIQVNRKFKIPVTFEFHGFMVQCLNEMPQVKDKSDSFFRRQIFIPFTKCFTGVERKYIKHDYLHRTEVLEYVLYKVLHMDYYELDVPDSCKVALENYKIANDVTRQFMEDVVDQCVWDLLPFTFLFDLYKSWMKKNNPNAIIVGKHKFVQNIINITKTSTIWQSRDRNANIWTGTQMAATEPLLYEYDLKDWMNPNGRPGDMRSLCTPNPGQYRSTYRGIQRVGTSNNVIPMPTPANDD